MCTTNCVEAADADAVVANWEQIKKSEKGRESVFDGVPEAIPALLYALKVQKKAASLPVDQQLPVPEVDVEVLLEVARVATDEDSVGTLLMAVVELARHHGIDPETALRTTALRQRDAARAFELSTHPEA
jgi:tetrapyrrole methylase family protein / MazG family protein